MFDREALPYEAAFLAGKAYLAYRRRGGQKPSTTTSSTNAIELGVDYRFERPGRAVVLS